MSYILDALRRADAERERGHVPNLHAQPTRIAPAPPAGARAPAARWRLAALALPVVLLLAWLTWKVAGNDAGPPAPSQVAAATPQAVAPVSPAPVTGPLPTTPVPLVATGESPSPAEAPGLAPARTAPAPVRKTALSAATGGARPSSPRSALSASSGALPASAAAAPARVYAVDELPDEIRRDLPKLAIGGSTYSESSASRFVIVNGQLCHEGDTLAPGLVLQQIKQKSAVLGFRGYRYAITL